MNTAVCKCPTGLEVVIGKVSLGRLQGKYIACNYWAEKLPKHLCVGNLGKMQLLSSAVQCWLECAVVTWLSLKRVKTSHTLKILSCLYLQRFRRNGGLPIGLVAKDSPKITNYVNDSEDKATWKLKKGWLLVFFQLSVGGWEIK